MAYDQCIHRLSPVGFVFGCYLARKNDAKLIAFWKRVCYFKGN
ncbi:unnamed protein product [Nyctereutes procyonoides]|uniref:(raccoon dog) hypothetical protein n=1 Tax=Nyctereutes procyonoides TaxID=34880 RepID=A0A811YHJ5_NYCPR|nr:unnamed protein product [Nyctereutes procyonoides]